MTRILAIIIIILASVSFLCAQEEQDYRDNYSFDTHGFGVHFGNISGNGYAYRYMSKDVGFQFVAGGFTSGSNNYYLPDTMYEYDSGYDSPRIFSDTGRKYSVNLGLNAIMPLKRTSNTLFYVHSGAAWFYSNTKRYNREYEYIGNGSYSSATDVYSNHRVKSYVNVGIGPGAEFLIGRYFKLALEVPITYTGQNELIMYIPQVGLYYYFK